MIEEKIYYTYVCINMINGNYYIGKRGAVDPLTDEYYGSGTKWNNEKKKYGIENFKTIIVDVYGTESEVSHAEAILIAKHRSKFCLNTNSGRISNDDKLKAINSDMKLMKSSIKKAKAIQYTGDDGTILKFNTATAAARHFNVQSGAIGHALHKRYGSNRSVGGTWIKLY